MVEELKNKSQTDQGQLQVTQAGNTVGIQMISQMQKSRQLQMAQMQTQNAFVSAQQSENDTKKTGFDKVFRTLSGGKVKQTTPIIFYIKVFSYALNLWGIAGFIIVYVWLY